VAASSAELDSSDGYCDDMTPDVPQPRPVVAAIPAYVPGKPAAPREGLQTYKLSSNENPNPSLPGVLEAATSAAAAMNRYPDMACSALYQALSARLGVPENHLALGGGSASVLYHLLQAYCESGDEVVYPWRSFEAYPIAVTVTGATPVQVPLDELGRHDLDGLADAISERTKVLLVCTPNNPTGPALRRAELVAFLDRVPSRVLVVIDEAYREFARIEDPVDGVALYRDRPNLAVLRTFSKAYGLAGLRVGYVVAHEPVATAVRACALPFGVSGIAQAAAVASLEHEAELLQRVEGLVAERGRVVEALRSQGWPIFESQGNFVWLALGERTAEFAAAAEEAGVMVRPFGVEGARATIGEASGSDVFLSVAARFAP
jgi:histidinol-phosphate aminotransferase